MSDYYQTCGIPKPEPRARTKRREKREHADIVAAVRTYVFGRERGLCRICRIRPADSMHELVPRSVGGKVSKRNSVAVCGLGTTGCHGLIQAHQIQWAEHYGIGAQGPLTFTPISQTAADWLRVKVGERIESLPMSVYESDV